MSDVTCSNQARRWVIDAENREQLRLGVTLPLARKSLARKMGVPEGTLHNIRRERLKGLKTWVHERIRAYVVGELQKEIKRLTNELDMAEKLPVRRDDDEIAKARAAIETARGLIDGSRQ